MVCGLSVMHVLWDQWITEMVIQIRNVLNVEPEEMTDRIKLTDDDIYWSEEYHHLTILCDLKDYEQLKQQILENQEKSKRLDSVLGSPYKITYHGASKYTSVAVLNKEHLRQILEKAKKLDDCLRNPNEVMQWSGKTISKWHLQIANNELLEQDNKQLKITLDECQRSNRQMNGNFLTYKDENDNLKQKLEKIEKVYLKHNPKITYGSQEAPRNNSPQITHGKLRPKLEDELKEILERESK